MIKYNHLPIGIYATMIVLIAAFMAVLSHQIHTKTYQADIDTLHTVAPRPLVNAHLFSYEPSHSFVPYSQRDLRVSYYLTDKTQALTKLAIKRPELGTVIKPALDDIITLQSMKVADKRYENAFDKLHSDLVAIDNALANEWF